MYIKKQNGVPGIAGRNLRENLRSINMTNPSDMRKQTGDYSQPGFRGQAPRIEMHSVGNENPAGGVGTGNPQTGGYQSRWQDQMNAIMDQILNRKEFSYDLNGDALYQQYKDQHMLQGQQAMMDTMGQAAALTGGYGNSWAQTAGQQAYQGHLQQLGNRIPELYNLALSKYQAEGQNLTDQLSLMGTMEERDYARWQDERNWGYQQERDQISDSRYDQEWEYQKGRDQVADDQWQKEFDEAKRQYDQTYELNKSKLYSGSGSSSSSSKTTAKTTTSNPSAKKGETQAVNFSDVEEAKLSKGFTGSTYSQAVDYLKGNGLSTSGLMTQSEWQRHKNKNNSAGGEHEASSYAEYLAAYVYMAMNK